MKNNLRVDQEVEKTLKSLDGLSPPKVDPFFYTRLKARLEAETSPPFLTIHQLRLIFAGLCVLLILNLGVISWHANQVSTSREDVALALMKNFQSEQGTSLSQFLKE
ncbi:MAG: hypothetical protein AAFR61_10995 [Bacteroidota bacterium]